MILPLLIGVCTLIQTEGISPMKRMQRDINPSGIKSASLSEDSMLTEALPIKAKGTLN